MFTVTTKTKSFFNFFFLNCIYFICQALTYLLKELCAFVLNIHSVIAINDKSVKVNMNVTSSNVGIKPPCSELRIQEKNNSINSIYIYLDLTCCVVDLASVDVTFLNILLLKS